MAWHGMGVRAQCWKPLPWNGTCGWRGRSGKMVFLAILSKGSPPSCLLHGDISCEAVLLEGDLGWLQKRGRLGWVALGQPHKGHHHLSIERSRSSLVGDGRLPPVSSCIISLCPRLGSSLSSKASCQAGSKPSSPWFKAYTSLYANHAAPSDRRMRAISGSTYLQLDRT